MTAGRAHTWMGREIIRIVCTNKGRHPEREVGPLVDMRRGPEVLDLERRTRRAAAEYFGRDEKDWPQTPDAVLTFVDTGRLARTGRWIKSEQSGLTIIDGASGRTFLFRCRGTSRLSCARAPRVPESTLNAVVDAITAETDATRRARLRDMSYWPC